MKTLISAIFVQRPAENLDWVICILFFSMLLMALNRVLFSNNFKALANIERFVEVNDNQGIFSLSLQLIFAALLGTLIAPYMIRDYDFIFYTPVLKVLAVAVIVLLFFALRSLFGWLGLFAFKIPSDQNLNFRSSSYYRAYSVAVLWMAVTLYYFSGLNRLTVFVVSIIILLIIRLLHIIYRYRNQPEQQTKIWYYNILYLCALEILPLLVLFKFLTVR